MTGSDAIPLKPLVSIVTPVYNAAQYLPAMLESVQAQTWRDYEHLLIDDCSTDESRAVAVQYSREDNRIRCLLQSVNGGPARARNLGISEAKGQFVAFLDADDVWFPAKLEKQLAVFRENPEIALLGTGRQVIDAIGNRVGSEGFKMKPCWGNISVAEFILDRIPLVTSSVMARKESLDACGNFNEDYPPCEDYELWLRFIQLFPVGVIEDELVCYRSHDSCISRNTIKSRISKIKILENEIVPRLELIGSRRDEFLQILQRKYISLGRMLMASGRKAEADEYFRKAVRADVCNKLVNVKAYIYKAVNSLSR